ncbi:general stress protein [Dictyobacter arantiisoli]|uniref:Uncharacterized protein n=1 Tax=Dictyobacter arantiisoli TaxID=2014874 RepID=A0A5A5TGY0_9CHLR|nr:general stress protein [Dictyobacter arantiisoli]GCF10572.1 hypothetical protein KDI_41360 [Dictyobacter arantiisoli]
MAINRSPIVGVFDEQGSAEHAIEELYQAGIPSDRISYSGSHASATGGNFIESIKKLFTGGHNKTAQDVANDLNAMGLSNEEAHYYAQEFDAGRTLVAVQSDEQGQNALAILRSNGAHGYHGQWNRNPATKYADTATTNTTSDYTQSDPQRSTVQPGIQSAGVPQDASSYTASGSTNANTYPTTPAENNSRNTTSSGYTDTNRADTTYNQDVNDPTYSSQQGYSDANRSKRGLNDPTDINRQGFSDPTRATNDYNQDVNSSAYRNAQSSTDPNRMTNTYNQNANDVAYSNQQDYNTQNQPVQQGYTDPDAYNQNTTDPTYTNQQDYSNANAAGQQGYVDPNRPTNAYNQDVNDPYANQQGYNKPNLTGQQGYVDPNRPMNTYNQDTTAERNQFDDPKTQSQRPVERFDSERNPDSDYDREKRNSFDKDQL